VFSGHRGVPEGATRGRLSQRRMRSSARLLTVSERLDRTRNTKGANYNDNAASSARSPALGKKFATSVWSSNRRQLRHCRACTVIVLEYGRYRYAHAARVVERDRSTRNSRGICDANLLPLHIYALQRSARSKRIPDVTCHLPYVAINATFEPPPFRIAK